MIIYLIKLKLLIPYKSGEIKKYEKNRDNRNAFIS